MAQRDVERIEGIVLRIFPSGESDLVLRVMTRAQGKLSLIAKHAKKSKRRYGNVPDVFDCGTFEIQSSRGSLRPLRSFSGTRAFRRLRDDLGKFVCASLLCEIVDAFAKEGLEDEQLFLTVTAALESIDAAAGNGEIFEATFAAAEDLYQATGFGAAAPGTKRTMESFDKLLDAIETQLDRKLVSRSSLKTALRAGG